MITVIRASLFFAISVGCLWCQQSSTGKSQAGSAPTANVILTGAVMMEDGSPVPGSVEIRLFCNGSERTVAHTTLTDDFEFQWNRPQQPGSIGGVSNPPVTPFTGAESDASSVVHGSVQGEAGYCDLRAWLPGYLSNDINLNNPSEFDDSNVGVLWLRPTGVHQGNMVSALTLGAPKNARKMFDKGTDLLHSGKLADAASSFQKAVTIYPRFADAWLSLGNVQFNMGANDAARNSLERALELDPKVPGAWQIMGYLAFNEKKWADAAGYLGHAEQLDPMNSPTPWFYSAVAYYELQKLEQAEKSIRTEIDMDPQCRNHRARYVLGIILIARHEDVEGSDALRSYLASSPDPRDVATAKTALSRAQTNGDR